VTGFVKPANDVAHRIAVKRAVQLPRHIADIRRSDHIGQFAQRVRVIERLDVVDVQRGACNPVGPKRIEQRAAPSTIGPSNVLIRRLVGFIFANSAAPTR
jgi:hypothetical protein